MIADTSFLVALFLPEDELHNKSIIKLEKVKDSEDILILDRVLEELFTVLTYKRGMQYAGNVLNKLDKNKNFFIFRLDENEWFYVIQLAVNTNKKLSFVDYAVISLALKNNEELLCFDEGINKLVDTLRPK